MHRLHLQYYVSERRAPRTRVFLPQNFFSFLEQGEKRVIYANDTTTIKENQFVLLSAGHCLMTEKLPLDNRYRSTMFFFDHAMLTTFLVRHAANINSASPLTGSMGKPFLVFEKDAFIENYIASLKLTGAGQGPLWERMLELKLEELLLYLIQKYPAELMAFQANSEEAASDFQIRKAVELNITNNLTLEELAFLCHTSVSTFKRRFLRLYNDTPSQYFLKQKMALARSLLLQHEKPGEIFYKVGYENHSGFSQAFKQVYGMSPKEFLQQHLTDQRQLLGDQE